MGDIKHQLLDLEVVVKELKKEIKGINRHIHESNKFAIKVMHAFLVTLCMMQERITGLKPKDEEDYKELFQFLKEKCISTLLPKRLGGDAKI